MGCCSSSRVARVLPDDAQQESGAANNWTADKAQQLQATVDRIFGTSGDSLLGLSFSFTIADPMLEGCPLVGCSSGFGTICGYTMKEIVGRNCRFLVDPVPPALVDNVMRQHAKAFCLAVKDGQDYWVPQNQREPWMPSGRPGDELFCVQKNARKDGTLFNNMFYLKVLSMGGKLGEEQPFIVGLQSDLPEGKSDLALMCKNLNVLDARMNEVVKVVAANFFISCSMRRQAPVDY